MCVCICASLCLSLCLQEPPKQQLLAFEAGVLRQLPRLSLCILQTPPEFAVYEALVDLQQQQLDQHTPAAVVSWIKVSRQDGDLCCYPPCTSTPTTQYPVTPQRLCCWPPFSQMYNTTLSLLVLLLYLLLQLSGSQLDGQPLATPDDCLLAEAIARDDVRVQSMVCERGVGLDQVACDPWAIHDCPPDWQGRRLMQVCSWVRGGGGGLGSLWWVGGAQEQQGQGVGALVL